QRRRPVSGLADLRGDSVELLAVAPNQRHEGSERGEFVSSAAPDAAAAAGDDDALAVERAGPKHGTILHGLAPLAPPLSSAAQSGKSPFLDRTGREGMILHSPF